MRRNTATRRITLLALWLFVYLAPASAAGFLALSIGEGELKAEIAATPSERAIGLSGRRQLDKDSGMLFVFEQANRPQFWMRGTSIPLSIAFIDTTHRIVELHDMTANSLALHQPRKPVRYALEMQRGWFKSKRITSGAQVRGLENLPSTQSSSTPESP